MITPNVDVEKISIISTDRGNDICQTITMPRLNLPSYNVRIKKEGGRLLILDPIRKKYVTLTPEEWVRQHIINYLVTEKKYPASLISVETKLKYACLDKRSDLLVCNRNGQPLMLIESKAPDVTINEKVFDQISIYNLIVQAPYIMASNGVQHYCLIAATEHFPARFINEIPDYGELKNQLL